MTEKKEEIPIIKEHEELQKIIRKYTSEEKTKGIAESRPEFVTKEFEEFQKGYFSAGQPVTFFEKACRFSSRIINVGLKKEDADKMNSALYYAGSVIEAKEVVSLSLFVFILALVASTTMFFAIGFQFAIVALIVGLLSLLGLQKYPFYLQRLATVDTLNSMPLAITYMVIYMRSSPNMEGAVSFAAAHLPGSLGRDLRKLVWDLQSGTYRSMDSAISEYAEKWQSRNRNFATAIELLRNSMRIPDENERIKTLDEAAHIILRGNLDMMQQFARGLRLPILVLYMLGIVLPVMGLVIAPVMTTLMAQGMSANALIIVYNIMLPAIIYVMLKIVLSKRPGGFSRPDISGYPGLAESGHLMLTTKEGNEIQVPLLPISILLFFVISLPGIFLFLHPAATTGFNLMRILQSLTFIIAAAAAIVLYTLGSSYQKLKVRNEIEELEAGLDTTLYQLSERLSMGTPIESAITASTEDTTGVMRGFFIRISTTMRNLGVPFEQALFDAQYGALRYYPSKLLSTIMEVLVESTKKGLTAAAVSLKTIGKFLENLRIVKNNIESSIGKTVTSMRFQAQFLTSFIAGIIISLDVLLFKILTELGQRVETLQLPTDVTASSVTGLFKSSMFNVASVVPAEYMQIIVGVYMLEMTVLLSMMINGVMNGRDDIYENYAIGSTLMVSTIVYVVALLFGIIIFSGFKL